MAKKHYLCGQLLRTRNAGGPKLLIIRPFWREQITTNYKFFNYKTQTTNKMKRVYTQPSLIVEEVMVESGIAASATSINIDTWTVDEDEIDF